MKKAIAILLVAVVAVASAFAGFSIDTRIVGVSAAYGVSYDYNNIEVGFETVAVSPVYGLISGINGLSQGATLGQVVEEIGLYSYVPAAYNIYAEYDFLSSQSFDLSAGLGLVYLPPFSLLKMSASSAFDFDFQPTLNVEFAYNFNANHAVTARVVFPFLFTVGSESQYYGLQGMAICSSIGYRYTF